MLMESVDGEALDLGVERRANAFARFAEKRACQVWGELKRHGLACCRGGGVVEHLSRGFADGGAAIGWGGERRFGWGGEGHFVWGGERIREGALAFGRTCRAVRGPPTCAFEIWLAEYLRGRGSCERAPRRLR